MNAVWPALFVVALLVATLSALAQPIDTPSRAGADALAPPARPDPGGAGEGEPAGRRNRGATRLGEAAPDSGRTEGPPPAKAASELPSLAQAAFSAGRPVVIMFSLRGCPWCDALRREHFASLLAHQGHLGITAFEIDLADSRAFGREAAVSAQPPEIRPASLQAGSPRSLGALHRVRFAPTVLFLGPDGEVAERLVGYGSPDFYGAYLEQRIGQARAALRSALR